ncbi:F-box/LRR-repeat protein At2g42730-like [Lolium rigidum]|uniref:F-box/LRR-repeat protein At2g42730-like n=1 Tax=Lolium rigidum TaxID=89674 RepID=UPI001F5DAD7A|nr:F-box/LRR-repeat protein At2g42730-like [Lolium rigidum]
MEAAVAALEAAAKRTARAASAAKEAAVAASAAATEAAGVASAAKEAVAAALATAEQAAAASSRAKEVAMAAEAAAKESAADAAATAEELAAAMRYSKKRRFHHGGSGGGNPDDRRNLDFISALPDEVLGSIISLLPTKDGARTQAISRRWLPLWRSAPLNLEVSFKQGIKNIKLIALVSKILSKHRGHARRLHLFLFNPTDIPARGGESKIDGWLRSQVLDGLQKLDFIYRNMDMPLSVFRFAPTLRFARFSCCNFPESVSALRLKFPCLKQLTLHMVTTTDGLHSMLTGCTALESLELSQICGKGGLCISSQTLRSIAFSADDKNEGDIFHLVIKEAPALERLLPLSFYEGQATIRVIRAPKLEIFGLLSEGMPKVQFGTTIFEKMIAVSLSTKIHTMKVLVLVSIGPNLDEVLDFLKCFPSLVRLYVISHPTKDIVRKYGPLDSIQCLELSLKKLVLMNYDGSKRSSVDFARFFILNTKMLKEMEIQVLNNGNDDWMTNQHKQLCVENRASLDARIELKIKDKKSFMRVDTHDLSMADPFAFMSYNQYYKMGWCSY